MNLDFNTLAVIAALAITGVSSYFDFKTREVENYITVGLIGLAVLMQAGNAYLTGAWDPFLYSMLAGGAFFAFGWIMFQTGQWGGADSKILIGLGILFANFAPVAPWPYLLTFFLNVFLVGFFYSIAYAIYLTVKQPGIIGEFTKLARADIRELQLLVGMSGSAIVLAVAFVYSRSSALGMIPTFSVFSPLLTLFVLVPTFWLLIKFMKTLEEKSLRLLLRAGRLREFDLLTEDILMIGRKIVRVPEKMAKEKRKGATEVIVDCSDPNGLTLEQIARIKGLVGQKKLVNRFVVKWGLPFVPVFFLAIIATMYFGDLLYLAMPFRF